MQRGGRGRAELAANATFSRTDRTAARGGADAASGSLNIAQGAGYEDFENAKKFAVVRMKAVQGEEYKGRGFRVENLLSSAFDMATKGVYTAEAMEKGHSVFGAIPILRQQAARAGFDLKAEYPVLFDRASSYLDRATAFGRATRRVQDSNVDPFGREDLAPYVGARLDEMRRADDPGVVNVNVNDQGLKAGADKLGAVADKLNKLAGKPGGGPPGGPGGRMPPGGAGQAVLPRK